MANHKIEMIGKRFGRLVVIKEAEPKWNNQNQKILRYLCQCDCGNYKIIVGSYLRGGNSTSCGCFAQELKRKRMQQNNHNEYDLDSFEFGVGYTNKKEEFYFDKEDYFLLKDYCWFKTNDGYLSARIPDASGKHILMHNLIMNQPYIDHINHIRVDNRKSNLRTKPNEISFDSINQMNKKMQSNNKSGCTGVIWHKRDRVWEANISINKKQIYLGRFDSFECAVKARKNAENKYFGEYSYDNSMKIAEQNKKEEFVHGNTI